MITVKQLISTLNELLDKKLISEDCCLLSFSEKELRIIVDIVVPPVIIDGTKLKDDSVGGLGFFSGIDYKGDLN